MTSNLTGQEDLEIQPELEEVEGQIIVNKIKLLFFFYFSSG
jgi:hypothetical protein